MIRDVIDRAALEKLINSFSLATGLNAMFLAADDSLIIEPSNQLGSCSLCKRIGQSKLGRKRCLVSMGKSGRLARALDEPYIAQCHAGLIEIYCPVMEGQNYLGVVTCGPTLLWQLDELAEKDITQRLADLQIDVPQALEEARKIDTISAKGVMAAADLLYAMANHIAKTSIMVQKQKQKLNQQQMQMAQMLVETKKAKETAYRYQTLGSYPLGKEQELLDRVRSGDRNGAKEILNELLSLVFSGNAGNIELIKARMLELMVMLSRAAVEGGAELETLLGMNYHSISELSQMQDFEQICLWSVQVLDSFIDTVYQAAENGVNVSALPKALEIMQREFAKPLTLSDVARRVHISPYYLSHVFRQELGVTFLQHLVNLRMQEAKRLLTNTTMNIATVAERCGYDDTAYFSKVFKRQSGVSPREFRKGNA